MTVFLFSVLLAGGFPFSGNSETPPSASANTFSVPAAPIQAVPEAVAAAGFSSDGCISEIPASDFRWRFNNETHVFTYAGPAELYHYYVHKSHDRTDYNQYALSEYDREIIRELAGYFKEYGEKHNHTETEITANVISFVQSIEYTSDFETKGIEDYPRYPIETLVDRTGDCEDTAGLAASILYELGYDCVLVLMHEHMALGVREADSYTGQFYEYKGQKYYYTETTSTGHKVGAVSPEIDPTPINIFPMAPAPKVSAEAVSVKTGSSGNVHYYNVRCKLFNEGPDIAKNITITVFPIRGGSSPVYEQVFKAGDISEDRQKIIEFNVEIPDGVPSVYYVIGGDNFRSFTIRGFYVSS